MLRLLLAILLAAIAMPSQAQPERAKAYRAELTRAAQSVFGVPAPVPVLAAQIHQESAWNPGAQSAFARGLTQFTPDTERWIQSVYGAELGGGGALDPRWAIRAMVRYDRHLLDALGGATPCDAWQFALSGYNGGAGWVQRDRKLAAARGMDPRRYSHVALFNAGRAAHFLRENRDYPERIVFGHQHLYATWGALVCH